LQACEKQAIDARAVWPAVHSCPAFTAFARGPLRVAETLSAEAIWLPTWSGMADATIARVVDAVLMGARELAQ
jgi:dTDP-4-amino-4,6-dideoxygalactose transaminase